MTICAVPNCTRTASVELRGGNSYNPPDHICLWHAEEASELLNIMGHPGTLAARPKPKLLLDRTSRPRHYPRPKPPDNTEPEDGRMGSYS